MSCINTGKLRVVLTIDSKFLTPEENHDLDEYTRFFESDWRGSILLIVERLPTNQIEKRVHIRRDLDFPRG